MQLVLDGYMGSLPACLAEEFSVRAGGVLPHGFSEFGLRTCLCCGTEYPEIDSLDRPVDVCNACVDSLTEQAALLYSSSGGEVFGLFREEDFTDGLFRLAADSALEGSFL